MECLRRSGARGENRRTCEELGLVGHRSSEDNLAERGVKKWEYVMRV